MGKRRKIGLIYQYNENWIGGTYYIENLIAAIDRLPNVQKPVIIIFSVQQDFDNLKKKIKYPYLLNRGYFKKINILARASNKITQRLFGKIYFSTFYNDFDLIFPAANESCFKKDQSYLYWIPDFQEHYIPEFFTKEEIRERKQNQANIITKAKYIVFSSKTAKHHFNDIYPANNIKQFVLPFAVTHQEISISNDVISKYNLPEQFYICSNQFWKHKNHQVILDAISLLKKEGRDVFIVLTGREFDSRNPGYFKTIKKKVMTLCIEKNVFFLGFIPRDEQLSLMKKAIAVIQPSLFEGWSMVIEDAKAIHANIIASDIEVHLEQLVDYDLKQFFARDSKEELANCFRQSNNKKGVDNSNYDKKIVQFGHAFRNIYENILHENK